MRFLLRVYPRGWRERYGDELLALLEEQPLTWRVRADVVVSGLRERVRGSGRAPLRVLWAWSLFVVGGVAFQKTSEHWQVVVPGSERALPSAAFHVVQAAALVGGLAVLAGVALSLPAFLRDLRSGGWAVLRVPILAAATATAIAAGALAGRAQFGHEVRGTSVFVAFALVALFAWTYAATHAARRLPPLPAHSYLALTASATMVVMTVSAAVWFGAVTTQAPSFVGAGQLAVTATFMLVGTGLALAGARRALCV
jgi:hypothetical protein